MNKKFIKLIFVFSFVLLSFCSPASNSFAATPKITSFSPSSGIVGATVNIKGTNLTPVDGVLFGVIPVNSLDVHPVSENELNVAVPANAKDGQITVKTGANGNAVSPLSFIVKNDSNIVLTPTTINPTSVTIGASGLVAEDYYVFYIKDLDGVSVISKFDIGANGNADGTAEVSFQTLFPEHNYEVRLDTKAGTTVSSVSFATPDDPNSGMENLSIVSSTATTVDLKADKLVSGNTYEIYLVNNTALTPNTSYNQKKTAVIANESATVNFSGLIASNNYVAYIIKNNEDKAFLGRVYFVSKVTTKMDNTGKKPAVFSGIVPLCNTGDLVDGKFPVPCDFTYLMKLINSIINFLLFKIATPLIALIIMYTGYLYITAGGSTGQTEKVRHILFSAVIGYVIALSAWLIVNTILSSLGVDSSINTFLK